MNHDQINSMITNAIIVTSMLSNEVNIQTKGEFLLPEEDYLVIVRDFQMVIARKIMPIRTKDEMKVEATKYIKELLEKQLAKEEKDGESNEGIQG